MRRTPLALVAALLALAATAPLASATFPGRNSEISFSSDRSGRGDIHAVRPDGSGLRTVGASSRKEAQSSWSPDGRWIAFRRGPDNRSDLFVAAADNSSVRQVADTAGFDSQPGWTPDGRRIVFRSDADGDAEILVTGYSTAFGASGGATQLTVNDVFDSAPNWSPDGRRIAFERTVDGNTDVYVMAADGSDVRRLTDGPALDEGPAFSPDGRSIVFTSERDGNSEIYVMGADGSNPRNITRHPSLDESPDWRPRPVTYTLRLSVSPRTARAGSLTRFRIRVTVVRAGVPSPVAGARVRIGAVSRRTDASGRSVVPYRPRRPGRITVWASGTGYRAGRAPVRIRRR